jgi:hypothetical protein
MGSNNSKQLTNVSSEKLNNLAAPATIGGNMNLNAFENQVLLMNMEDTSTEDFDLQYMPFENKSGTSLGLQQLFAGQINPSFVDADELQQLTLKWANNKDSTWVKKSAKDKMSSLWSKISADQTPAKYPFPAGIFAEPMEDTFSMQGDAMPAGRIKNRTKYIHSVGATGKVKFVPKSNKYSGLFQGASQGIIRFSSAA